jgi:N-methylhydantoinase A
MPRRNQSLRIAIDTGGTFTDCVWIDDTGRLQMLKVFSTPADPSQAIVQALRQVAHAGPLVLLHGTTVGTNTLLERKGARTALVTTAGFEDAIEIGRQSRRKLYDLFFDRVPPLVSSNFRFGVEERTASDGEILIAASSAQLELLTSQLSSSQPQSIAISLLFSFANPTNELAVADALEKLGIPLSVSHQILPEFREYERTSTVVVNAYLQPVMSNYLESLKRRVASAGAMSQSPRIFVMQSSGGIAALSAAAHEPVRTVLSGPAGGVVGAAVSARRSGFERIIAFDMGGTSTDVSLVEGAIATASRAEVAGLPIGVPILDIHTVGAGGGSLARFDAGGVLRAGPESAGADPGPICYGRGTQPTVTDANLLLGRLHPERFLGGDFALDLDRARSVTREWLKKQQSVLTLEKFAAGVIRVINSTMEKAIRVVSIERGRDPREFALVAFGGAGGLHACALAESLSIPHVIAPALPGALSAVGILLSDVIKDHSQTVLWRVSGKLPVNKLSREFSTLKKRAAKDFREEGWSGKLLFEPSVDLRYRGQGYELNLPLNRHLLADFEREHTRRYGYAHHNREIELVTLRLRSRLRSQAPQFRFEHDGRSQASAGQTSRQAARETSVWFDGGCFDGKKAVSRIYSRDDLKLASRYRGPAIITEYSATTVVPANWAFHVDRAKNLIISRLLRGGK